SESEFPFSRTALMYVYMGHLKFDHTKLYEDHFWDKNRIGRLIAHVNRIDTNSKTIFLSDNSNLNYDSLIIATGSKSNKFGWPGQDLNGVQGLYSLQDLESMELKSNEGLHRAVIVGGGLIGVEMAEMFHSRGIQVSFLVREASFWNIILPKEESAMINRHLLEQGIDLRLSEELSEIKGKEKVESIITKSNEEIVCQFVGLTVGVSPNIDFVKDSGIKVNRGIQVDEFLQTNIEDVYAIGDCAELLSPSQGRKAIEAVWYTGRMMGQTVASTLCGNKKKYNPGVWFNSAKFFDIEYQVYGYVPIQDDQSSQLYWEHPEKPLSIRLVYNKLNKSLLGVNLMGIRYRHEVCEAWIRNGTSIESVLENLSLANFDPEFFEEYESNLISIYNSNTGQSIKQKSKRKLNQVSKFLQSFSK
ncbi:MAG: NAD(P)/FAD-dependent oxidoreductase, partial [Saprospiraceae bacterium]